MSVQSPLGVGPLIVKAIGYVKGTLGTYAGLTVISVSGGNRFPISQLIATAVNQFAKATGEAGGTWALNDTATATINGHATVYTAGASPTPTSVIAGLAAAINADSTSKLIVKATALGNVLTVRSLNAGATGEYTFVLTKSSSGTLVASNDELQVGQGEPGAGLPADLSLVRHMTRNAVALGSGGGSGVTYDQTVDNAVIDYVTQYG